MLKNTHIKTIMTFLIIGITIITTMCLYQIEILKQLNIECTEEILNQKITETIKITVVLDCAYSLLCLIIAFVTSKLVDKPITKLLKDANKVISTNKKEKKNKNTDEIVDTFNIMTDELKENLNEMTRQKSKLKQ